VLNISFSPELWRMGQLTDEREQMGYPTLTDQHTLKEQFAMYKDQVYNRVAHSMGCHPEDLDGSNIIDYFAEGMTERQAADAVENALNEERPCPQCGGQQ